MRQPYLPAATMGRVMTWNFNMDEAPRDEKIIAAGSGGVVTVSRWIADQKRWNMFALSTPPIAWQPWPSHPEAIQ